MLWSGLCCYTEGWGGKCSEILATIKLLYNPRVNKVFTNSQFTILNDFDKDHDVYGDLYKFLFALISSQLKLMSMLHAFPGKNRIFADHP